MQLIIGLFYFFIGVKDLELSIRAFILNRPKSPLKFSVSMDPETGELFGKCIKK